MPSVGLVVIPQKDIQTHIANEGLYAAGTISALDTPRLEHAFILHNQSASPILIARLQPSCHCTTAVVDRNGKAGAMPLTLAPGQQATVRVDVDLAELGSGSITKTVSVFTPGHPQPAALLMISATLLPSVSFTPTLMDFGTVRAGENPAQMLTITYDTRLAPDGQLPVLLSSNPDIRLSQQPVIRTSPGKPLARSDPRLHADTRHAYGQLAYRITLAPDAALGPLNGILYFGRLAPGTSKSSQAVASSAKPEPHLTSKTSSAAVPISPGEESSAWNSTSVLIVGQVRGAVSATPNTLAFGTVRVGQPITRQISLSGSAAALKVLVVESASPWLTASLVDAGAAERAGSGAAERELTVSISPQAPPGILRSQIKATFEGGRRLLIPVTAYITATPL